LQVGDVLKVKRKTCSLLPSIWLTHNLPLTSVVTQLSSYYLILLEPVFHSPWR
jgi:hypothetical protein